MNDRATVGEVLQLHYAASGLPRDGGRSARQWTLDLGPMRVRVENFEWRRRALQHHDMHHVVTGYACTVAGELEIAAWEFAAGRFPSLLSTLFCLPLVGFGAVVIPRRSFAAFVRGRRSRTLYATSLGSELMTLQLSELRGRLLPAARPSPSLSDRVEYLGLVCLSLALAGAPFAVLAAFFMTRG